MTASISPALEREIKAFLYAEARMLQNNQFDDWLGCFTNDVHYWMPVRQSTEPGGDAAIAHDSFCLFDDDKKALELRVLRIKTGDAHAELPPSITCRLITNIFVEPANQAEDAWIVHSNFMVYQERRNQHGVSFYGGREDLLRLVDGKLKIAKRRIDLAQAILPTTISIFF